MLIFLLISYNSIKRVIKKEKQVHIFSGKVFCYDCKKIMRKKSSSKHEYLVCKNKNSIRYDVLEKIVLYSINKKVKTFKDFKKLNRLIIEEFIYKIFISKKNRAIHIVWNYE